LHNDERIRHHHPPHYHRTRPCPAPTIKKYVFEVAKDAGKIEIKKAVEEIFGVKVKGQHPERPRQGKAPGRCSSGYDPELEESLSSS
jgi:hypothetical protein